MEAQQSRSSNTAGRAYLRSFIVAIVLAVLTAIEYIVAIELHSTVLLLLLATFKGVAVLWYYMHVSRLWSQEGEH